MQNIIFTSAKLFFLLQRQVWLYSHLLYLKLKTFFLTLCKLPFLCPQLQSNVWFQFPSFRVSFLPKIIAANVVLRRGKNSSVLQTLMFSENSTFISSFFPKLIGGKPLSPSTGAVFPLNLWWWKAHRGQSMPGLQKLLIHRRLAFFGRLPHFIT